MNDYKSQWIHKIEDTYIMTLGLYSREKIKNSFSHLNIIGRYLPTANKKITSFNNDKYQWIYKIEKNKTYFLTFETLSYEEVKNKYPIIIEPYKTKEIN